ncbi:hypothetical protein Pint_32487 [Pistacia integerrima]|uniref:Uncharacterized protein n=1 Tax=Pistacia integerrima TaxID=434235 RepID=A0ACC0XQ97_9ROSI|nr:hypothetical protein Pint_32487 [Pistacia integerrima]
MEESNINITVKFITESIPITASHDSTVQRLKSILVPLTSVHPVDQKLIFKGRILDNEKSLRESEISNGAKIMLVGTKDFRADKGRIILWKYTKRIDLAAENLKDIPEKVWPCAPFIRTLNIGYNSIQQVPHRIDCFIELRELYLSGNDLSDESISWRGLTSLKLLQVLCLALNCLNTLPPTLGLLTSLQRLDVGHNNLTALPIEIGNLTELEDLDVNNNWISSIPASIGNCTSLIKVNLSSNYLSELPDEFCRSHNLKALDISDNAMKSLPNSLFKMCDQLSNLDLRNTEITRDTLLQYEGWEDFDERRRAERQRRREEIFIPAEFDELADIILSDPYPDTDTDGSSAS